MLRYLSVVMGIAIGGRVLAVIFLAGLFTSGAGAAVVGQVFVRSSTELEISLSGTFDGPLPSQFDGAVVIDFGSTNIANGSDIEPSITGGYSIAGADGSLFRNSNSRADAVLALLSEDSLEIGQSISGSAVFSYNRLHQIREGLSYDVYWGTSAVGEGGTFQSVGVTSIPEPGATTLFGLAVTGFVVRRRKSYGK